MRVGNAAVLVVGGIRGLEPQPACTGQVSSDTGNSFGRQSSYSWSLCPYSKYFSLFSCGCVRCLSDGYFCLAASLCIEDALILCFFSTQINNREGERTIKNSPFARTNKHLTIQEYLLYIFQAVFWEHRLINTLLQNSEIIAIEEKRVPSAVGTQNWVSQDRFSVGGDICIPS